MNIAKILVVATALGSGSLIARHPPLRSPSAPPFLFKCPCRERYWRTPGVFMYVGDITVIPNGNAGTTGSAQTTNLSTGATFVASLPFVGTPAVPNQFNLAIPYNVDLFGPWTLNFTNGPDTASAATGSIPGLSVIPPFASNVTVSGSSANPTFSWTFPAGSVNGVNVNIFDQT